MFTDEKQDFLVLIHNTIMEHPDWMADIQLALQEGIQKRLQIEIQARSNSEVALSIAYDAATDKRIPVHQRAIVWCALANALFFKGTPYQEKIMAKLQKEG